MDTARSPHPPVDGSLPRPDLTLLATMALTVGALVSVPALGYGLLVLVSMGWTYATVAEPHPFTALGWIWVVLFGIPGLVGTVLSAVSWWNRRRRPGLALLLGVASLFPAMLGLWVFLGLGF